MESPFNDEIFDHDNDEIFQNDQLETDSLWCNSLIDISEYDNQFFHDDSDFNEMLINNSHYTQPQDTGQFSLDIEDNNNLIIPDFELSPKKPKSESTFDSKLYNSIQKHNFKQTLKSMTSIPKSKSELFIIENSSHYKYNENNIPESHNITNTISEDLDDTSYSQNEIVSSEDNSRKNLLYFNQNHSLNRRQNSTIFVAKRNSLSNIRKPISKFRRQDNSPLYSIYQDTGNRNQIDRLKYSLSPLTSSPDSAMDSSLSGNGFQQALNDDVSLFNRHKDTPNRIYELKYKIEKSSRDGLYPSKLSSTSRLFQSPIPQSGILILTEEEKRTLLLENYSIPTRLPLTKQEERNLKKVRRKIKNKISAQESRRKKKEYMEALEKKVEVYAHENNDLKKRLESQESLNKSLLGQLRHLQQMIGRAGSNTASTCLMVFLLCFSLILVGMPNRYQTMKPPQSVLVVSNIHKFGYGSIGNLERTQMTAMQRYFPPDIDTMVNPSSNIFNLSRNDSLFLQTKDKGNEPTESMFNVNNVLITNPRKGILLENTKEEEEECIQYGPKYSWWRFPTANDISNDERQVSTVSVNNDRLTYIIDPNNQSTSVHSEHIMTKTSPITVNKSHSNNDNFWSNKTQDQLQLGFFSIST